ncbi:hypothetical protein L596_022391 [Steinernema carpocapsae]|uniref:Uncharacterized protein n=2 Tax=Steinernema carpocapsae TaxID=34508 RepID=A0A4U5MMF2_STECR|nr:hypothetical protein L596_022391 [Steinernema carpocapsae]
MIAVWSGFRWCHYCVISRTGRSGLLLHSSLFERCFHPASTVLYIIRRRSHGSATVARIPHICDTAWIGLCRDKKKMTEKSLLFSCLLLVALSSVKAELSDPQKGPITKWPPCMKEDFRGNTLFGIRNGRVVYWQVPYNKSDVGPIRIEELDREGKLKEIHIPDEHACTRAANTTKGNVAQIRFDGRSVVGMFQTNATLKEANKHVSRLVELKFNKTGIFDEELTETGANGLTWVRSDIFDWPPNCWALPEYAEELFVFRLPHHFESPEVYGHVLLNLNRYSYNFKQLAHSVELPTTKSFLARSRPGIFSSSSFGDDTPGHRTVEDTFKELKETYRKIPTQRDVDQEREFKEYLKSPTTQPRTKDTLSAMALNAIRSCERIKTDTRQLQDALGENLTVSISRENQRTVSVAGSIIAEGRRGKDSRSRARQEPKDKGINTRFSAHSGESEVSRRDRPPAPEPKRIGENEGKRPTTQRETKRLSGEPKARTKERRSGEPKEGNLGEPRGKRRRETSLATVRREPSKRNPSPPAANVIAHREEEERSPSQERSESEDESSRSTRTSRSPSPISDSD